MLQQPMAEKLEAAASEIIKKDLGLDSESKGQQLEEEAIAPEITKMADEFVAALLTVDPTDSSQLELKEKNISSVENLGAQVQKDSAIRSSMLKEPIRKLAAKGEDGGAVANALVDLNVKVEELDPGKFDLEPGWLPRMIGLIPGVGTPMKKYFIKFESAQTVLDAIFRSLEDGADMLKRDNLTLSEDQKQMRLLVEKLKKTIQLGQVIDGKLQRTLDEEIPSSDARHKFIAEELLFPLRQRILDLQQQLAVNQQAILALEIIIRNNKELIRGVNRALNVTTNALNVAVVVALALANQKIVLNKIEAVNTTTNKLIADTAKNLKEQGAAIHKQAASSQLDMNTLKQAFTDISSALDDISKFRQEALPQMANTILEMESLTKENEESIKKLEKGTEVAPAMFLEIN